MRDKYRWKMVGKKQSKKEKDWSEEQSDRTYFKKAYNKLSQRRRDKRPEERKKSEAMKPVSEVNASNLSAIIFF